MLEPFFTYSQALKVHTCLFETHTICSTTGGGILELNKVIFPRTNRANIVSAWRLFLKRQKAATRASKFVAGC